MTTGGGRLPAMPALSSRPSLPAMSVLGILGGAGAGAAPPAPAPKKVSMWGLAAMGARVEAGTGANPLNSFPM
jgi:hypothetical protein